MDNHTTKVRSNRTASALEDSHPTTDLSKWVVHGITDVQPEELSTVVVWIVVKGGSRDIGADLLDCFLIHIGVEDVCSLVWGRVVRRVRLPLVASRGGRLNKRIDLSPHATSVGEARNLKVDHVVEPTEGTLDTKRSDKLARGGIADVLTEFAVVTDKRTTCLWAGDQSKDGNTILFTKSVVTCTIADKTNTKLIKLILCQLEGRNRNQGEIGVFGVVASLYLANKAQILGTTTIVQDGLGQLSELFHGLSNLGLNLERGLQIVQADARGLISLCLKVPVTNSLTEGQIVRSRDTTIAGSPIGKTNIRPAIFKATRENTLHGNFVKGRSHSLREFADTDKTTPRAIDGVTLVNVNGEPVRFPLKKVINCRASNCHNIKKLNCLFVT